MHLQHIGPLATGAATQVGGGHIEFFGLRVDREITRIGRRNHAQKLALQGIEDANAPSILLSDQLAYVGFGNLRLPRTRPALPMAPWRTCPGCRPRPTR